METIIKAKMNEDMEALISVFKDRDEDEIKRLINTMDDNELNNALAISYDYLEDKEKNRYKYYECSKNPKQGLFHRSNASERFIFGGNNSGKTSALVMESIWYATGMHPYKKISVPNEGWIVSVDMDNSLDVVQKKFFYYAPLGEYRFDRNKSIVYWDTGSETKFKSQDSGVIKFSGARKRYIGFDEKPKKDIYEECTSRQMANEPLDIWTTMTPLEGMDWIYDEKYEPSINKKIAKEFLECWVIGIRENGYLSEKTLEDMIRKHTGSENEASRLDGMFMRKEGLLYKMWRRDIHVKPWFKIPIDWCIYVGIDPHPERPFHILWLAVSPSNKKYIIDELVAPEEADVKTIAKLIKEKNGDKNIVAYIMDTSGWSDEATSRESIYQAFGHEEIWCRQANKKDWENGHQTVIDALTPREYLDKITGEKKFEPDVYCLDNCIEFQFHMEHAVWKTKGKKDEDSPERPKRKYMDFPDCFRYILMASPEYTHERKSIHGILGQIRQTIIRPRGRR